MTLLAFDFDNTLSDSMMLVLLCQRCGVSEQNREITERVHAGELGYADSLRERVSLLSSCTRADLHTVCEQIHLRPGAPSLLRQLHRSAVTIVIISGGFERCIERVLDRYELAVDRIFANQLVIRDGTLTGDVTGPLVEQTKETVIQNFAADSAEIHEPIVAVGDGRTDRPLLDVADISIGFQPESTLRSHCDFITSDIQEVQTVLESENII
ncbi:MAG: phosphoserine phosphatase SerB [Halovenus sp.]